MSSLSSLDSERRREYAELVLTGVRELFLDRKNWVRGRSAEDEDGRHTEPCHPDAVRWCATGAITKIVGEMVAANTPDSYDISRHYELCALYVLESDLRLHDDGPYGGTSITRVNDSKGGYYKILAALDRILGTSTEIADAAFRRAHAARRGWETRRRNLAAQAAAVPEAPEASPALVIVQPTKVEVQAAEPERIAMSR